MIDWTYKMKGRVVHLREQSTLGQHIVGKTGWVVHKYLNERWVDKIVRIVTKFIVPDFTKVLELET